MEIPPIPSGAKLSCEESQGEFHISWYVPAGEFRRKLMVVVVSVPAAWILWLYRDYLCRSWGSPSMGWIIGALVVAWFGWPVYGRIRYLMNLSAQTGHAQLILRSDSLRFQPGAGGGIYEIKKAAVDRVRGGSVFHSLVLSGLGMEVKSWNIHGKSGKGFLQMRFPGHQESTWVLLVLRGWLGTNRIRWVGHPTQARIQVGIGGPTLRWKCSNLRQFHLRAWLWFSAGLMGICAFWCFRGSPLLVVVFGTLVLQAMTKAELIWRAHGEVRCLLKPEGLAVTSPIQEQTPWVWARSEVKGLELNQDPIALCVDEGKGVRFLQPFPGFPRQDLPWLKENLKVWFGRA